MWVERYACGQNVKIKCVRYLYGRANLNKTGSMALEGGLQSTNANNSNFTSDSGKTANSMDSVKQSILMKVLKKACLKMEILEASENMKYNHITQICTL